ncbi:hypothetical protein PMG11_08535 [Penicillium brasilianum]|uniref:Uncharacterized protein n=1 Tax=Penicillium brasilianum TaxID=104259 RepID=A0A0F7TY16_PENBI|nr:hypothetical protein PMG11_08535 [Penicillium brasilianum]
MVISDSVWQDFDAETFAGMNDSKILSSFTSGFFGGFIFGTEGLLLNAGAWRLLPVNFTNFSQSHPTFEIWKSSEVPEDQLCDVGTRLFGTFQLLDKHISESTDSQLSYVDFGFGSDKYSFAGCHRFSITRHRIASDSQSETEPSKPQIRISLEGFTCNPQTNELPVSEIGKWFHALYARALFANGIQAVLQSQRPW